MKKFIQIVEDSQDAGYSSTLETPRKLGSRDYIFVDENKGRDVGETVVDFYGKEIAGSKILRNEEELFQYQHKSGKDIHIESVEVYRDLWLSIHVPSKSF